MLALHRPGGRGRPAVRIWIGLDLLYHFVAEAATVLPPRKSMADLPAPLLDRGTGPRKLEKASPEPGPETLRLSAGDRLQIRSSRIASSASSATSGDTSGPPFAPLAVVMYGGNWEGGVQVVPFDELTCQIVSSVEDL